MTEIVGPARDVEPRRGVLTMVPTGDGTVLAVASSYPAADEHFPDAHITRLTTLGLDIVQQTALLETHVQQWHGDWPVRHIGASCVDSCLRYQYDLKTGAVYELNALGTPVVEVRDRIDDFDLNEAKPATTTARRYLQAVWNQFTEAEPGEDVLNPANVNAQQRALEVVGGTRHLLLHPAARRMARWLTDAYGITRASRL